MFIKRMFLLFITLLFIRGLGGYLLAAAFLLFFSSSCLMAVSPDTLWFRFTPNQHEIASYDFSPDDSKIATFSFVGSNEGLVVFNTQSGDVDTIISGLISGFYSSDGNSIICADEQYVYMYDANNYKLISQFEDDGKGIYVVRGISYSNEGKVAAPYSSRKGYRIWDVETGKIIYSKEYPKKTYPQDYPDTTISDITLTPDGKYLFVEVHLVIAGIIKRAYNQIIETKTMNIIKEIDSTYEANVSGDSRRVVFNYPRDFNNGINVYNIENFEKILTIKGATICPIEISNDGRLLAVLNNVNNAFRGAQIWDVDAKKIVREYLTTREENGFGACAFSNNTKYFIANSGMRIYLFNFDPQVGIMETETPVEVELLPNPADSILHLIINNISIDKIIITDILGNIIKELNIKDITTDDGGDIKIDVKDMPVGAYYIQILSRNNTISEKFLIQR